MKLFKNQLLYWILEFRSSQIKDLTFIDATPALMNLERYHKVDSSDDDRAFVKQSTEKRKPAKVVRAKTQDPPVNNRRRRANSCKNTFFIL